MAEDGVTAEPEQVLEFDLGSERYCIGIEHVSEIVDVGEISRVPDTPPHVLGVMAFRGETARIVDPKHALDVDGEADGDYVIVLAGDGERPTGWLVDAVYQVTEIDGDQDRDGDGGAVEGVVHRDDGFVIVVDPEGVVD